MNYVKPLISTVTGTEIVV